MWTAKHILCFLWRKRLCVFFICVYVGVDKIYYILSTIYAVFAKSETAMERSYSESRLTFTSKRKRKKRKNSRTLRVCMYWVRVEMSEKIECQWRADAKNYFENSLSVAVYRISSRTTWLERLNSSNSATFSPCPRAWKTFHFGDYNIIV